MKNYELMPTGTQKSFYQKAYVIEDDNGNTYLQSYSTIVCGIVDGEFLKFWDGYSSTTSKHIHAYRLLNDLQGICKKEWENLETMPNLLGAGDYVKNNYKVSWY